MEEVKRYVVSGYEFTDVEFASKVEPILQKFPELSFEVNENELVLPFESKMGEAKIFMSNRELEIQVVTYNPSMDSRQVLELDKRGIFWEVCRGVQYYTRNNPTTNVVDNFEFLYEFSKTL